MSNIIKPYDNNRSLNCAVFIRDYIGIENVVQEIFIDQLNFNLFIINYDIRQYVKQSDIDLKLNELNKNISDNKNKPFIIIFLSFLFDITNPSLGAHINIIFIDNLNNKYYYYEPHFKYYKIQDNFVNLPIIKTYKKENMPESILTQTNLPFCYMYCLHFFLFLLIEQKNDYKLEKYTSTCDNLYIMRFIRDIMKLCHLYNLINYRNLLFYKSFDYIYYDYLPSDADPQINNQDASDLLYYILTNNTYKIKTILDKNVSIDFKINYVLQLISSTEVEQLLSKKINTDSRYLIHLFNWQFAERYLQYLSISQLKFCDKYMNFTVSDIYLNLSMKNNYHNIISFYVDNYKNFYGNQDGKLLHRLSVDDKYLNYINTLITNKYDLKETNSRGQSAVYTAVKHGSYMIVKTLIDHDKTLLENKYLLRIACLNELNKNSHNMILIIIILLDNGFDINYLDDDNNTIIHNSTDTKIIKFIVSNDKFININKQEKYDKETILYKTSVLLFSPESIDLVKFLLENGATKSITMKTSNNATSLSTENLQKKQILESILAKCTNPIKDSCNKEDLEDNYFNFDYNYSPEYDSSYNKIQIGKGFFSNQYIYYLDSDPSKKVIVKKLINSNIMRDINDECNVLLKIKNKYEYLENYVSKFKFAFINPKNEYYIVSEYDENMHSLDHYIANKLLSDEEKSEIINKLIKCIIALHNNQIVHLDIKPNNIIYNKTTKTVKLIDFGNSCLKENTDCKLIGSMPYHPYLIEFPIISDSKIIKQTFDTKIFIDLYSLGITIYNILVGNEFPQKLNKTVYEYTQLVLDEAVKKFTSLNLLEYKGLVSNMYDRLESIINLSKSASMNFDIYDDLNKNNYLTNIMKTEIYLPELDLSVLRNQESVKQRENTYINVSPYTNITSYSNAYSPELVINRSPTSGSGYFSFGGTNYMKNKYLKYKYKYLQLKHLLKN
jgi:serine/threonine protein kinase